MRITSLVTLVALVDVAGCEKNLIAELPDAAPDASPYCSTPAQPLAPGTYKLYLNTDGVTLTPGTPDARTNATDLVPTSGAVVPAFLPGLTGRQAFIDQIVSTAQGVLAPYAIDIVTARPTTGDYYMFVLGGVPADFGNLYPSQAQFAFELGCHVFSRDTVALIFDGGMNPPYTANVYASALLNGLGALQGLGETTAPADCMCINNPGCGTDGLCTFGSNVPTSNLTTGNTPDNCGHTPTEDEPALLEAALGCR